MNRLAFPTAICLALKTLIALPQFSLAQGEPGTVSGNGVVVVSRNPELMRVQVALQGKGGHLERRPGVDQDAR